MKNKILDINKITNIITESILDKKGFDIKVIHVGKLTSLADVFIICTSDSGPQSRAITNHIKDKLLKIKLKPWHIEGYQNLTWVLMDYVDIIP